MVRKTARDKVGKEKRNKGNKRKEHNQSNESKGYNKGNEGIILCLITFKCDIDGFDGQLTCNWVLRLRGIGGSTTGGMVVGV